MLKDTLLATLCKVNPAINSEIRERIANGANLMDIGVIDSLNFIELIAALENELALNFSPSDVSPDSFATIDALEHLITKLRTS